MPYGFHPYTDGIHTYLGEITPYPTAHKEEPQKKTESIVPDYVLPDPRYRVEKHVCTKPKHVMMWNEYRARNNHPSVISHHTKRIVDHIGMDLYENRIIVLTNRVEIGVGPIGFTTSAFVCNVYGIHNDAVSPISIRNEVIYDRVGMYALVVTYGCLTQYLNEVEL